MPHEKEVLYMVKGVQKIDQKCMIDQFVARTAHGTQKEETFAPEIEARICSVIGRSY
jgi:hypothetical protein